jgi:hypothetical protein
MPTRRRSGGHGSAAWDDPDARFRLTNSPIAIAGNTVLVPAGGPSLYGPKGGSPQLVAYTVR